MKTEENVYEEKDKMLDGGKELENPSVLGKFRSVDALAKAYGSLQAEFTRRSQRLKELERMAENSKTRDAEETENLEGKAKPDSSPLDTDGSETAEPKEAEREILAQRSAHSTAQSIDPALLPKSPPDDFKEKEIGSGMAESAKNQMATTPSPTDGDALYKAASENESVRLKIIGDYLSSLKKPQAILTRGGGTLATPPLKAKSIFEAGELALKYFKKD